MRVWAWYGLSTRMNTSLTSAKLGVIVGGTRYSEGPNKVVRHSFDLLDLDSGAETPNRVILDFLAHGFSVFPKQKTLAVLLEKRGPGGALVDLKECALLKTIDPLSGHHFYGHGSFSQNGDVLFAVETNLQTNDGVISVRDPNSFQCLEQFPTYGMAPHDCVMIDQGKTLVITNGGGDIHSSSLPCVTFVDVATRRLLEKYEVDEPAINTGHIALRNNRDFVVVSAPRDGLAEGSLGGVSLRIGGKPLKYQREPKAPVSKMFGESLSVCIDEKTDLALATHPFGHFITFWDMRAGSLLAALDLPNPRGVTLTLDGQYWVVSFGPAASLILIKTKPLEPIKQPSYGTARFSGSHIYTYSWPVD